MRKLYHSSLIIITVLFVGFFVTSVVNAEAGPNESCSTTNCISGLWCDPADKICKHNCEASGCPSQQYCDGVTKQCKGCKSGGASCNPGYTGDVCCGGAECTTTESSATFICVKEGEDCIARGQTCVHGTPCCGESTCGDENTCVSQNEYNAAHPQGSIFEDDANDVDAKQFIELLYKLIIPFGVILGVLLTVSCGYKIMTSQGDPKMLADHKECLTSAIMGLAVIIVATSILRTVLSTYIGGI
ncbi:MAG: hypothetical protein R3B92_01630 [Patescibacteria group bacterium]|uniref:Uncharacterized protein n=1 Tax=candidate division WWE3 bacterium TaxID=2053526 RepID=A0A955EAW7_UNCKA|nr:hypothetical protein [candidate division WWE3 bacterium]